MGTRDGDADKPQRKRSGKAKPQDNTKLWLLLGCGGCGAITVLGGIVGAVLLIVFWPVSGGVAAKKAGDGPPAKADNPLAKGDGGFEKGKLAPISAATAKKLGFGLTRAELEEILGPGKAVTEAEIVKTHQSP